MGLQIIGTHDKLVTAINNFNPSYHADYFSVRSLAKPYLCADHPDPDNINALASVLHVVMKRYGAEIQKAPTRRDFQDYEAALKDENLHNLLRYFNANPLSNLRITNGKRSHKDSAARSDKLLIQVLNKLSNNLFKNNTNVTYPMKSLMLLTSYIPALDSNVKSGLSNLGLKGLSSTQFLLPKTESDLEGKKITSLPYILAECYSKPTNKEKLDNAVQESNYKSLKNEVGRIFDILLFTQGKNNENLFEYRTTQPTEWYSFD